MVNNVDDGKVYIVYTASGIKLIGGTVSGTSISFDTEIDIGETGYFTDLAYDSTQNRFVITWLEFTSSNGTYVVGFQPDPSTNLTAENYIGISDGAYADAATATVQIVGSVDDAQSGLTAGQSYYVQIDGTLNTTADDPSVFAGTAVSATKLIVKG